MNLSIRRFAFLASVLLFSVCGPAQAECSRSTIQALVDDGVPQDVIEATCGSGSVSSDRGTEDGERPVRLAKLTYWLPRDGVRNDNRRIGPFCCTGHTATIESTDGEKLGYVYFYGWQGNAYNIGDNRSAVSDIQILVSGATNLTEPGSSQQESSLHFWADRTRLGHTRERTQAGRLCYEAVVERAEFTQVRGARHFEMGTIIARIDVAIC